MGDFEPVEPSPRLDASRPTFLRLSGFVLAVTGALVAGLGALLVWVTVGIRGAEGISPSYKGVETTEGRGVLAAALVMLAAVLLSRLLHTPASRKAAAVGVLVAGVLCVGLSGAFLVTGPTRFEPFESQALIDGLGVTESELEALLEAEGVVGFTDLGAGPYVALLGGAMGIVGGVLILSWAARTEATQAAREKHQAVHALF